MKKLILFLLLAGTVPMAEVSAAPGDLPTARENSPNAIFGVTPVTAQPEDLVFFIPAQLGGVVFTTVGNVVGWPVKIGCRLAQGNVELDSFVPPNSEAVRYVGTPGAYLLGTPFWCLKKAFWDGPVWLFSSSDTAAGPVPEITME